MNFVSLSAATHPAARHDVQRETANYDTRDNMCNVCAVHAPRLHVVVLHAAS